MLLIVFCANGHAAQVNASLISGYEKITSPLVRIDFNGSLILVEGLNRLEGRYNQLNASVFNNWVVTDNLGFNASANTNIKQAPDNKDLNYSQITLDGTFRKKIDDFSLGMGASVQRIWIANSTFRDSASLQSDLTYIRPDGGFTNVNVSVAKSFFVEDFDFFDNKSATISMAHHSKDVGLGFSALDLQLSATRQKNVRESDDLSNFSYFGRASLDRKMLGLTWSVGASVTNSYFDEPFFDGFAKRADSYVSYEFGVEREFSNKLRMSLDFNKAKNSSNLALFESNFRAVSFSLNYNF